MLNIQSSLRPQFEAYLQEKAIPKNNQALYQKDYLGSTIWCQTLIISFSFLEILLILQSSLLFNCTLT